MIERYHYERAFEEFLRGVRRPYVAVDEARRTLLPFSSDPTRADARDDLKSFDFMVYGEDTSLIVDVKGRRFGRPAPDPAVTTGHRHRRRSRWSRNLDGSLTGGPRLESWVTREDVASLLRWETMFGAGFEAVFAFVYSFDDQPPDAVFDDAFCLDDRWYTVLAVPVRDYGAAMVTRSERWQTVHLPRDVMGRLSRPLSALLGASEA